MMAKAAIFDVDGTLVDSVDLHARAWQEALSHFGKKVSFQDVREQIGKGGDQLLPVFFSKDELRAKQKEIEEYRKKLFQQSYLAQVKGFPDVRKLFERLRQDAFQIALASSAKGDELNFYKRASGIEDLVEAETSSDDAEKSKPEPDIFIAALGRLKGVMRERILVVGDTPYDAEAAGKAGLRTIGLLSGGFAEDKLRSSGCIAIYQNPSDLLSRYKDSPFSAL